MSDIMDVAVREAIEENRRLGITPESVSTTSPEEPAESPSATIRVEESPD